MAHPLQRRWRAEELARLRPSDDRRRAIAPQRAGRIDPNPHQIEAVAFALGRLPEGGCLLADEVGLGKTIEAGLVIAQRWAEGARRVLLLAPKALVPQWEQELFDLFGLETVAGRAEPGGFSGPGIYLCGREMATSPKTQAVLLDTDPMDLVVVDEAHELFANLFRRMDKTGENDPESKAALRAGALYDLLYRWDCPALLLTATPIQNSLAELWSLVRYVDRSSTLLGPLDGFRALFCEGPGDRRVKPGAEEELRRRLRPVLQRTLRRQAQPFLKRPFVERQARTFEYEPSAEERALQDDVIAYVQDPASLAFRGGQRRLLMIGFHRRMASSRRALADSLDKVASRLGKLERGEAPGPSALTEDLDGFLDEDPGEDDAPGAEHAAVDAAQAAKERRWVEALADRARRLGADTKLGALIRALGLIEDQAKAGRVGGKVVIFTESLATQSYLVEKLVESGLYRRNELTMFRGDNRGPEADAALAEYRKIHHGASSRDLAVRAALVHEFRTRTRLFLSTEAGAKGLNLQFAETLVNYDLPWNPQRIEQRIGRCHRYGQTRAVTVLNFLDQGNEAERLLYGILSEKLDLFGRVLDATDQVLHAPGATPAEALTSALGPGLETEIRRIYERARSQAEIAEEHRALVEQVDARRREVESVHARAAGLIDVALDSEVRRVLEGHERDNPPELAAFDEALARVVTEAFEAEGRPVLRDEAVLRIEDPRPEASGSVGKIAAIGWNPSLPMLSLSHPWVEAAVQASRRLSSAAVRVRADDPALQAYRGRRARFSLVWVRYDGLETFDAFLPVLVLEGEDEAAAFEVARALEEAPMEEIPPRGMPVLDFDFDDAVEEALYRAGRALDGPEAERHRARIDRLERGMEDRAALLRTGMAALDQRISRIEAERDGAQSVAARDEASARLRKAASEREALEDKLARVEARDDPTYRQLRDRGLERRYAPPTPTRIFDVEVEFA